jgi:hypothetical protein
VVNSVLLFRDGAPFMYLLLVEAPGQVPRPSPVRRTTDPAPPPRRRNAPRTECRRGPLSSGVHHPADLSAAKATCRPCIG